MDNYISKSLKKVVEENSEGIFRFIVHGEQSKTKFINIPRDVLYKVIRTIEEAENGQDNTVVIKRTINGTEYSFLLTEEEIELVRRKDKIQWAKDVLANYSDIIIDYINIVNDEEKLVAYADLLEEKNLTDNGDREIEAIKELFKTDNDD